MARVMYARYYATITLNRELFEQTLKDVLATPASVWPEERLANELAHRRAARYLKQRRGSLLTTCNEKEKQP